MSTGQDIEHLLIRRLQGRSTDEENRRIMAWAAQAPENQAVLERLETEGTLREDLATLFQLADTPESEARLQRMRAHIQKAVSDGSQHRIVRPTNRFTWRRYVAAAAILIIGAVGGYYYQTSRTPATKAGSLHAGADVQPGGNRATLTLADGRTIDLSEAQTGIVIGDEISYADGSAVVNAPVNEGTGEQMLTLTTPKAGTYQITLPDGTDVWLNAASTLTYPSRFRGGERVVELEGEAYFDVREQMSATGESGSQHIPFNVRSNGQVVEVLGTAFNVSAYPEEAEIKTTLVEGGVRVVSQGSSSSTTVLAPGQQSVLQNGGITVTDVNTLAYTAWKDGMFYFKRTPLEEIMRQVARWYDVEVIYQHGVPNVSFSGRVDRGVTLMELLEIFQVSSVNVTLKGNSLFVH